MNEKKISILLVEDEENLQEALKLNLELEDYEVTSAWNGVEALEQVQKEHFDLMILDVMLPELDGISVCENIRLQNLWDGRSLNNGTISGVSGEMSLMKEM